MAKLSFQDICLEFKEHFPTDRLLEKLSPENESKQVIDELDFRGIQYLTDEAFYGLLQKKAEYKEVYETISTIDCTGCIHLTDQALKQIGRIFPNLSKIKLDGCREITEKGLSQLGPNVVDVSAVGCNIRVPVQLNNCLSNYSGCPLIVSKEDYEDETSDDIAPDNVATATKLSIFLDKPSKFSMIQFLNNEPQEQYDDIAFRKIVSEKVKKDEEKKVKQYFNIFECQNHASYYSPLLSEKGLYMIALNLDKDILQNVMMIMGYVKGIVVDPVFIIVLLCNNDTELPVVEREQFITTLATNINERLDVQNTTININMEEEAFDGKQIQTSDFKSQQRFSRAWKLQEKSKEIEFYIFHMNTDNQMIALQYPLEDDMAENTRREQEKIMEKMKQDLEEKLETWMSGTWNSALESINTLSKSDITELKSFASAPQIVLDVMQAVLIAFNNKDALKEDRGSVWRNVKVLLSNPNFLQRLLNYSLDSISVGMVRRLSRYVEKVQIDRTKVLSVSKCSASFWTWILALLSYGEEILPLMQQYKSLQSQQVPENDANKKKDENNEDRQNQSLKKLVLEKGPAILWKRLNKQAKLLREKEELLQQKVWKSNTQKIWAAIQGMKANKIKICVFNDFLKEIHDIAMEDRMVSTILEKLHYQGHILFYPSVPEKIIILDVSAFCRFMNKIHTIAEVAPMNNDRSVALNNNVPFFDRDILCKANKAFLKDQELDLCLSVVKYFGLVLDIPHVAGDDNTSNKPFMFCFPHVQTKAIMRSKPGAPESEIISGHRFTRFYWPEGTSTNRLKTDAYVNYTYRMAYGMPPCVFTQVLSECVKMGQVIHVWLFGFVVRCGTVDIKIQHNVHAFNFSSYIDVDARVTFISEDADHRTVQEHLWSVVNTYLLVIEYYMDMYKLQAAQRIKCQGSCSQTDLPHFFGSAEIKKEHNYIPKCTLCGDDQMSVEKVGYITGKRGILPFHDLMNPEDKDLLVGDNSPYGHIWNDETMSESPNMLWMCYFCGMSKEAGLRLWEMQCKLWPVPDCRAFKCTKRKNHSLYYTSDVPLYVIGCKGIHVTPITNCNIKLIISRESYVTEGVVFTNLESLHQTRMLFDLKSGEYIKLENDGKTKHRKKENMDPIKIGDRLTLDVVGTRLVKYHTDEDEMYRNHKQFVNLVCVLKKNDITFTTFDVPYRSHASILIEQREQNDKNGKSEKGDKGKDFITSLDDGVLIECPTYPYVQVENLPLGGALLYKTGLGNQYAVGFVHSTENGKVAVENFDGEILQPKFKHLLPIGLYTDITVTTGKDMIRTKEHMLQLLMIKNRNKVPYGMFMHLYNKKMTYTPVHLRSHHLPITCTWNEHAPCVLEQLFNRYINSEGKSGKFNPPENHVLLPYNLSIHDLIHAPRQTLQNWEKMNVYFVCKGPQWGMYNVHERDMHFMKETLKPEAPIPVCTKLHQCKPSKKRATRSEKPSRKLSQIKEENEEETSVDDIWKAIDSKVHLHAGDHMQIVMACHFMLKNKEGCLPSTRKKAMFLFESDPEETFNNLEFGGLYRILSMYKDTFMWLDRLLEVANDYDVTKNNGHYRLYNKFLKTLFVQEVIKSEDKKQRMCHAHDFINRKQNFAKLSNQGDNKDKLAPVGLESALSDYASCIQFLNISTAGTIGKCFEAFLSFLPNLKGLSLTKCNIKNINGINQCFQLEILDVSDNHISSVSEDLLLLKETLTTLIISGNPITQLPAFIVKLVKLKQLNIGNTLIRELPEDIGNLSELRGLSLRVTMVNKFPKSLAKLQMLKDLNLQGVPWIGPKDNVTTFDQFHKWASRCHATKALPLAEMFEEADTKKNHALDEEELDALNEKLIKIFPRIGQDVSQDDPYGGLPKEIFSLHNLKSLAIGGHLIHYIPDAIENLRVLRNLYMFYTPNLLGISSKLGKANLNVLSLAGCFKCKTPPQEIIQKGMKVVLAYLKNLSQGSSKCYRTKLMFVGLGGAGKTSLTRALMAKDHTAPVLTSEAITDGIDISTWTIKLDSQNLQYSVWDFAGQTVYYNTHQFFLSNRALYMLVWNTRLGYEHSGLDFWLSSIASHCPNAPIFIIGTHADQITKPELPMDAMKQRHPNIAGFFVVSSISGMGISELHKSIVDVTLQQPYMGEMIPDSWLSCERAILHKRGNENLLSWSEVDSHAHSAGVYGDEVIQAVRFLHELGTVQHFENDLLKDRVVINPQWIVDVMACVVSVHNKVIVKGYLQHKDISKIWSAYSPNIHDWLLRLTEVFDLTFPLHDKPVSVVPCLLDSTEPYFKWPDVDEHEGAKETKIVYSFDYLPAGLFNRAQVRLYQFSETSNMWKTGSILVKNNHHALVKQIGSSKVMVKVFGLRPENILLLIHEVFESLIADFFQGVKYEYQIPCPDCTVGRVEEPTMFTSKVLRKAIEMKALFLQCHSLFHTLSIVDIQSYMPPQSGGDYEIQLETAVRDLDDLGTSIGTDLFILYCDKDIPEGQDSVVDIRKVKDDLQERGFKCWFAPQLNQLQIEQVAVAMKTAKIVVVLISNDFVLDEHCKRMFSFAKESLRKDIQLVVVGKGREWMQSGFIGIQVSDEVFVNLQRLHQYNERFDELCGKLTKKLGSVSKSQENTFDVFLSYAWVNSTSAVEQGQATAKDGSLGHGDPRVVKQFLTENGISCWIDIEQVGRMGLYEDIASGMKQSKVIVACVSDEYALSANCQIEFRFAHTSLRKPIILAVVGTGFMWESTEIGMLSLGYPKINFQVANNVCHSQLLQYVQEALDSVQEQEGEEGPSRPITPTSMSQKEMAFQELYEMAQRKFLRQVCSYNVGNSDPYPRLMVADLNYDPSEDSVDNDETITDTEITLDEDSVKPLFIIDDLQSGQFCIKVLCEYEGGWHCVHQGLSIDLSGKDLLTMWRLVSPYMARMLAILKHSNINLHIVRSAEGDRLLKDLEQLLSTDMHIDVEPVYLALRSFIMNKDVNSERGGLKRCYMPSGKMLWLCEEHQALPRVTVLEDTELEPDASGESPELTLMSVLEKEMGKKSTEEAFGGDIRRPSQAARHIRPKSAKLTARDVKEKTSGLRKRHTVSESPSNDVTSFEDKSEEPPNVPDIKQSPKTKPQLTEKEKTQILKRVSKENLVSMMGIPSDSSDGSGNKPSQACAIL